MEASANTNTRQTILVEFGSLVEEWIGGEGRERERLEWFCCLAVLAVTDPQSK